MRPFWELTAKRRENLVKVCLNAVTVDLGGIVAPLLLPGKEFSVMLMASGVVMLGCLVSSIFYLER